MLSLKKASDVDERSAENSQSVWFAALSTENMCWSKYCASCLVQINYNNYIKIPKRWFEGAIKLWVLSTAYKLYSSVLNDRLAQFLDQNGLLEEKQSGFPKGKPV